MISKTVQLLKRGAGFIKPWPPFDADDEFSWLHPRAGTDVRTLRTSEWFETIERVSQILVFAGSQVAIALACSKPRLLQVEAPLSKMTPVGSAQK